MDTSEKIEILEALWPEIIPHQKRGSVIIVNTELNLKNVAATVAEDDQVQVKKWIEAEKIGKPKNSQIETWQFNPDQKFLIVIVQPFVLIQVLSN